jgi:phosphoglycerate dehydrogenase-like enzyme
MNTMGILSRDAGHYRALLEHQHLGELQLGFAEKNPAQVKDFSKVEILLADPDLAASVIEQCASLRWLQSTWAGNAPLLKRGKGDYRLCGIKDVFGISMREYVFAYLLHFSRNVDGFARCQKTGQWQAPAFTELHTKTLGIMGVGSMGKLVAKTAKCFDMQVHGLTYASRDCPDVDRYFNIKEAQAFAADLDYLVCLLPDTRHTQGVINQLFLAALPPRCVLINAGRGQAIDEPALLLALNNNKLRAAVLDVTRQEPLPPEHPFWHTTNLHITQHTAAISKPKDIHQIFLDNYQRYSRNRPLKYQLDFAKGY